MGTVYQFLDRNGKTVRFTFSKSEKFGEARHVWVICRLHGRFVLTKHKTRGLEFPGGKLEEGETPEQAAKREVFEETGGIVERIRWIGQYEVQDPDNPIIKDVFLADLSELVKKKDYLETDGPVCMDPPLDPESFDDAFSFLMKDDVLKHCLEYLNLWDQNSRV